VSETLDQVMWEAQQHFRISIQVTLEGALEGIGASLDPQVVLVGFALDREAHEPVCIEPAEGPLKRAHLAEVGKRSIGLLSADPDGGRVFGDSSAEGAMQARRMARARASAVAEAIESSGSMPGKRLLVSAGNVIGGYYVHTGMALDLEVLADLSVLEGDEVNGFPTPPSLTTALLALTLAEADEALAHRDPGLIAIRRSPTDLIAAAAQSFVMGCGFRTRDFSEPLDCARFDQIAQQRYEGASADGSLLVVDPAHDAVEVLVEFQRPVLMDNVRAVRKLLEMSSDRLALLLHKSGVYGLGRLRSNGAPDIVEISFPAHATWEIRSRGKTYMRSAYSRPRLPAPTFDVAVLADTLERRVPVGLNVEAVSTLVSAAIGARHGTTLVVSSDAAGEAARLAGQSTTVRPTLLDAYALERVALIDGAVLIDPSGTCHAIGVILDGAAAAKGDPSRGARFNSALKYIDSAAPPAVIIVVSEDGDVTQVPELPPRVRRQDVVDALLILESAAQTDGSRAFNAAFSTVCALAFYLSEDECNRVNELTAEQEDRAIRAGHIAPVHKRLHTHPDMTDEFFSD
jgi:hypothetical protein